MLSSLSPSQQPIVLFSIYENNTLTISPVHETINPATQRIILKILKFLEPYGGQLYDVTKNKNREIQKYDNFNALSKLLTPWCGNAFVL